MYVVSKRLLDLVLSLTATVVLAPLLLAALIMVRTTSPGPIFYTQKRLGLGGRTFDVYKFRTMTDKPRHVHRPIMKGDAEVTAVGYWLRRFKVDELPQLFNIIRGEMSIVGPRPALPDSVEKFNDDGRKRLNVRPGLTGYAQVNGNIYLSWEDRWRYDAYYVDNCSLLFDAKIILKTIGIVIFGEDRFIRYFDD